jgi:hypothetical protein
MRGPVKLISDEQLVCQNVNTSDALIGASPSVASLSGPGDRPLTGIVTRFVVGLDRVDEINALVEVTVFRERYQLLLHNPRIAPPGARVVLRVFPHRLEPGRPPEPFAEIQIAQSDATRNDILRACFRIVCAYRSSDKSDCGGHVASFRRCLAVALAGEIVQEVRRNVAKQLRSGS